MGAGQSETSDSQIVLVAEGMLSGDIDFVAGCRRLVRLRFQLDAMEDELFDPIVAFESEVEDLPLGEERSLWSPEALARKDREVEAYLRQVREVLVHACEALIEKYGRSSSDTIGG